MFGYKVRDSIRDFILTKKQYEDTYWVHRRESAYLQNSQMKLNASNPFYTDGMGNAYKKISMNDLFYKDVFSEFMLDYVNPLYDDLKTRFVIHFVVRVGDVFKDSTHAFKPFEFPTNFEKQAHK
ncbi:hypothetical protein OESDEN_21583 [Oesophagostomum dentatum]|uniref:Uncharacterized protein n=1 Tax=Oesophagostomum dentatum TaxID=61180 RepID=A0A0B1S0C5_OESDE|nr:hypothetical protein OESDEN_21583 [Oesophagostomum dentatum]